MQRYGDVGTSPHTHAHTLPPQTDIQSAGSLEMDFDSGAAHTLQVSPLYTNSQWYPPPFWFSLLRGTARGTSSTPPRSAEPFCRELHPTLLRMFQMLFDRALARTAQLKMKVGFFSRFSLCKLHQITIWASYIP